MKKLRHLSYAALAITALSLVVLFYTRKPEVSDFANGRFRWTAFGGAWHRDGTSMRNDSDERGAKILTGSTDWRNYSVEADVAVLGDYGDSGLIIRAQEPAQGVDAYRGYFAGVRTLDNALIFGSADYAWKEYRARRVPGDVQPGHFYHIKLIAVDCDIAVKVTLPSGLNLVEGVSLRHCVRSGQAGLKSFQSPGLWRNFLVTPATRQDLLYLLGGVQMGSAANGTLLSHSASFNNLEPLHREAVSRRLNGTIRSIADLQSSPLAETNVVAVHGVVRLNQPVAFIEDSTGAIQIENSPVALTIGEDVEITGRVRRDRGSLSLRAETIKELGSSDTASIHFASAEQAATGRLNGRTTAVDGTLRHRFFDPEGRIILELEANGEMFRAITQESQDFDRLSDLDIGSQLQIIGTVLTEEKYASDAAFALLVPPTTDSIRLLNPPPFWSPEHIGVVALGFVCVFVSAVLFYTGIQREHLTELANEREVLAHDLHDTLAQSFAGIGFQLNAVSTGSTLSERQCSQLRRAQEMVKDTHDELRRSIATLRTEVRTSTDLRRALEKIALLSTEGGELNVTSSESGSPIRLPARVADVMFRVGQEAIANTIHHSHAKVLSISTVNEGARITLCVRDDGEGLPEGFKAKGSGLYGMKRRADMIGATLLVHSSSSGTSIELRVATRDTILDRLLIRINTSSR